MDCFSPIFMPLEPGPSEGLRPLPCSFLRHRAVPLQNARITVTCTALAKKAKSLGSAAVFASLVLVVLTWGLILI